MSSIRLENISLKYGGRYVLKDVNLTVEDKELCVLFGPSGCGKSLILRIIAGLVRPTEGNVYIDGQLANDVSPSDRDVAMLFQGYALYPYLSVRENWSFPLRAERLPEEEIAARIQETSDFLQMDALLERSPRQLSGGQQQRAALGRALVRRPRMYLLDEPLSAQDAKRRVEMRTGLRQIQMERGITTLVVTSDQIEAQALGDKMVVMDIGTIQQVGTPEEIYEQPLNLFVADFVGSPSINLFDCTLSRDNGALCVSHPNFKLRLPPEMAARVEAHARGEQVVLGVRPEYIDMSLIEHPGSIPAQIYVIEPQSDELLVDLMIGETLVRLRANREDLTFEPELDQRVYLTFLKELVHVFDRGTGLRVS